MKTTELNKLLSLLQKFSETYKVETEDMQTEVEDILNKDTYEDDYDSHELT